MRFFGIACRAHEAPADPARQPIAELLHSPEVVPVRRAVSFTESLKAIWRWWRPRPVPLRERQLAEAVGEWNAAEFAAEVFGRAPEDEASLKPPIAPKRPRRRDVGL